MKQVGPTSQSQSALPLDVITQAIWCYLSPEEIVNFKTVCSQLSHTIENSIDIDAMLQPLLNRLKKLNPLLSISPLKGQENTAWRIGLKTY